jgi:hypothetical protein
MNAHVASPMSLIQWLGPSDTQRETRDALAAFASEVDIFFADVQIKAKPGTLAQKLKECTVFLHRRAWRRLGACNLSCLRLKEDSIQTHFVAYAHFHERDRSDYSVCVQRIILLPKRDAES